MTKYMEGYNDSGTIIRMVLRANGYDRYEYHEDTFGNAYFRYSCWVRELPEVMRRTEKHTKLKETV